MFRSETSSRGYCLGCLSQVGSIHLGNPGLPKSQGKYPVAREGVDIAKLMLTTHLAAGKGATTHSKTNADEP